MIALLDACVLFPRVLRDALLDVALVGLYRPHWSDRILDELRRNLIRHRGLSDDAARRLVGAMAEIFPEAAIDGYEPLIPAMANHPKDRHVLAAAVAGSAELIVTSNLVDFPTEALAPHGLIACSPDEFFRRLFDAAPGQMVQVLNDQAANYQRPPMSVDGLLTRLAVFAPTLPDRFKDASG